jgi:hypothetical protein
MPVAGLGSDEEAPASPFGSGPSAKLIGFLERRPSWRITALGVVLLGGLWVIDRTTAPDVSFPVVRTDLGEQATPDDLTIVVLKVR